MVNRPADSNPNKSRKWPRADLDWYRESPRVVEQLMHGIDFGDDLIWDPCCGAGNVLDVAERYGHPTIGSDVVDRHPRHRFIRGNVLSQIARAPRSPGRETSIICNPPYSYVAEVGERVITHCLENFAVRRAAFIVPVAFINSQDRWGPRRLLRWKPSHLCIYRERHTMPPGELIDVMDNPYDGGMADYVALVWTRPHRWLTETIWLAPGHHPDPPRRINPKGTTNGRT